MKRDQPEIRFFAGLWTLREYPDAAGEWSVGKKFEAVKAAGFEGIGGRFVPEAPRLCEELGLDYVLYIDAGTAGFEDQFRRAADYLPKRVNVQLGDHDTPPEAAAAAWISMVELAETLSLPIDLELHRDTATETPEKAAAIASIFRRRTGRPIRWCLDHSHFAVAKHLMPPFAPRLLDPRDFEGEVRQIHFRPFNGHHAQIPATDGRGKLSAEFRDYLAFADELLACWLASAPADAVLFASPENGPRIAGSYGLSCFPDVWQDAIVVRDELRKLWRKRTA
jgi:hypothetical protein